MSEPCPNCGMLYVWDGMRCCRTDCRYRVGEPLRPIPKKPEYDVGPVADAVLEYDLDCDEILRRGGANYGDENFALLKCPKCGTVYLLEWEVETMYVNAEDLTQREDLHSMVSFPCICCGVAFPKDCDWIGPKALKLMQVTWDELAKSPWRWVTKKTREMEAL